MKISGPVQWAAYLALFLLLDWAGYIRPLLGLNITPWNPQPAVAIALLLWAPRRTWLVALGLILADILIHNSPFNWTATLGAGITLTCSYAIIARALGKTLHRAPRLSTRVDLYWLCLIALLGAAVSGVAYVASLTIAGGRPPGLFLEAIFRYWIGDFVGIIIVLPILLIVLDADRRATLAKVVRTRRWWGFVLVSLALFWLIFGQSGHVQARYFYLILLPLVAVSTQFGLAGAALASTCVQTGLIVAVQSTVNPDLTVFELQLLMGSVAVTCLLLGMAVDERQRANNDLRSTLRLAAAGQLTAALAHELGQPLTAINNYARACQLILEDPQPMTPGRVASLRAGLERLGIEVTRAGEIVKRLREFFRSGALTLRPLSPATLLAESVAAMHARAKDLNVVLEHECAADMPDVLMDGVQIQLVVRNLLSNAIEAASKSPQGRVTVRAQLVGGMLSVDVLDNGPGARPIATSTYFQAVASEKVDGMGIGLSICRIIVEAHGGQLVQQDAVGGCFGFSLPGNLIEATRVAHGA